MHVKDKINMTKQGLIEHGPITIVAFGDSVTHGALQGEINYETVYWNLLKKKLNAFNSYIPVNVICAGIGGITAKDSLGRLDKQVIAHNPDLVIVCFGLNDVNGEIEDYINALEEIFRKCKDSGSDVIFMTPNMLNTRVHKDTEEQWKEYAQKTADMQNGGRMDMFMNTAMEKARMMGVSVCDCYGEWKKLSETQDITELLINRINHPTQEMHNLFANKLYEVIFEGENVAAGEMESTMYKG